MKFINLKLSLSDNLIKIPSELMLYIGKLAKNKVKTYLYVETNNPKTNKLIYDALFNLVKFYKITNVSIMDNTIPAATSIILPVKLPMFFSPALSEKNIDDNIHLSKFVSAFEKLFGFLPFYTENKKFIDKFLFINDVILKFGSDIILH